MTRTKTKSLTQCKTVPKTMTVWKKAYRRTRFDAHKPTVVELLITRGTRVCFHEDGKAARMLDERVIHDRKCQASRAKVIAFYETDGQRVRGAKVKVYSGRDPDFFYPLGEIVKPSHKFDKSRQGCASGIHFFIDLSDAIKYSA